MSRRASAFILGVVAAIAGALLWWHATPRTAAPALLQGRSPSATRSPVSAAATADPVPLGSADPRAVGSPLAAELNAPDGDGMKDVQTLHALIRQYLRMLHHRPGPPIGDDIDLAHALTGHNPLHVILIPPGHSALSPDGHLRDRWGTPYFVHALGYGAYEVRSAGPDRKKFTADDLVDGQGGRTDFSQ